MMPPLFLGNRGAVVFDELLSRRRNLDLRQLESWKSTAVIGQLND